ncbi:MAG TPA: low affinity iron permease family protein [Solirubrobacterales bacterium]|jgi:low affinity Fe/Cu permease|nr:low affinity iron permease family protein [Solirubrobacterales bacterium]
MSTQGPTKVKSSRWSLLRHPTERGEGRGRFDAAAETASNLASSSFFFSVCLLIVLAWIVGLLVGLPSQTENDLIGVMAALTLLLVALLKNSERRAERAMQLKLDAIAAALLEDRGKDLDDEAKAGLEDAVRLHEEI